jgi:hypothetical protein
LDTSSTGAENTVFGDSDPQVDFVGTNSQTLVSFPSADWNNSGQDFVDWIFTRAPGFFDVVCYKGNGSGGRLIANNLGVAPEFIICKNRSSATNWIAYHTGLPNSATVFLNSTVANLVANDNNGFVIPYNPPADFNAAVYAGSSGVTAVNTTGDNYVMYLFATCPGVSKVFSYTGNGSSQTINCGFTGGARFVMVKRTDSTGNWLVVDTARGLVSAGDPTLYLNSTAAEVTGVDWIDPDNSGFIVNQEGTMNANVSSATYIGLAIA